MEGESDLEPQDEEWFKLNFNEAVKRNPGSTGVGDLVRNHKDKIISHDVMGVDTKINNEAEAPTLWKGTSICIEQNLDNIRFEGDMMLIVQEVNEVGKAP